MDSYGEKEKIEELKAGSPCCKRQVVDKIVEPAWFICKRQDVYAHTFLIEKE